jgi:hypothetical protein
MFRAQRDPARIRRIKLDGRRARGLGEDFHEQARRIAARNCDFPQCACISFNKLRAEIYQEREA